MAYNFFKKWYLVVGGALMLAFSFYFSFLWFLCFFALVPLFIFLYGAKSNKIVFGWSLVLGFLFSGAVGFWLFDALPLTWLGIENNFLGFFLVFAAWLVFSVFLSLFIACFCLVFYKVKRNFWGDIFIAGFLWVLFEYLRAFAFSFLVAGPASVFGPHWTLGFLGYILAENQTLLSLAGLGGVYLLGFFVVCVNVLFYRFLFVENKKCKILSLFIFAGLLIFLLTWADIRLSYGGEGKTLKVAVVHTSFNSVFQSSPDFEKEKTDVLRELLYSSAESEQEPDMIVFPEDSRFIISLPDEIRNKFFSVLFSGKEKLVVDSGRTYTEKGTISRFYFLNTKNGNMDFYEKEFLMPGGEYLPYFIYTSAKVLGQGRWLDNFADTRTYQKGSGGGPVLFNGVNIGALFCSEIVSPVFYKELEEEGAQVLINAASHGSFHGSRKLFSQILKMAKVRAVENNVYFVRAGNFSPSFVINNRGVVVAQSIQKENNLIYAEIRVVDK